MKFEKNWIECANAQFRKNKLSREQEDTVIKLLELCSDEPQSALQIILNIVACKPGNKVLNYLGAGPLEDLLVNNCDYISKVISIARKNILFQQQCLAYVNLDVSDCSNTVELHEFLKNESSD